MPITTLTLSGEFYRPDEMLPEEMPGLSTQVAIITNDGKIIPDGGFMAGMFWEGSSSRIPKKDIRFWSYDVTIKEA